MPSERPVLFFLPGLGLGARVAEPLAQHLADLGDPEVVGLDLVGTSIEEMVDHVVARIAAHAPPGRWGLVGHSMGGKIATAVAARTTTGRAPLFGLAGIVLLAGSPPSPEPMEEPRRAEMIGWADGPTGPGPISAEHARTFVDANTAGPLPAELDALAIADVQATDPELWTAWLTRGSLEDWTTQVGVLDIPALLLAGADDGDLAADAQRALNGPVYPRARLEVVTGAAHLLMLEQPARVAELVHRWWVAEAGAGPTTPTDFAHALASRRTSARTRSALAVRALGDDPAYAPQVLTHDQLSTLRAVATRVVPQGDTAEAQIDLAARLDAQLAGGVGDGWRYDGQPTDVESYRQGLDALAGFADLDADAQHGRLRALGESRWFQDCCTDLVRHWLAHPATMARIGYDGVANGGDGERFEGFATVGLSRREGWEPAMAPYDAGETRARKPTRAPDLEEAAG